MKSLFTFTFDSPIDVYRRKYMFNLLFPNEQKYELILDWAETTEHMTNFLNSMQKYGFQKVDYNPSEQFYGIYADDVSHKLYIWLVEEWKHFFEERGIACGNIEEVFENRFVS